MESQVADVLELIELQGLASRRPAQLSGGQQQRVALARAIVNRPAVLLLDEPLGALDLKLRRQMQVELKRIQTEVGLTFVHVTHDQEEAMTMADTIAVMNAGRIEQLGTPADLYENPATTFAANFLGQSNLIRATVRQRQADSATVALPSGTVQVPTSRLPGGVNEVWVGVRPEKISVHGQAVPGEIAYDETGHGESAPDRPAAGLNRIPGAVVIDASFMGVSTQYLVRTPWGQQLMVFEQNRGSAGIHRPGEAVSLVSRPSTPSPSTPARTARPASSWTRPRHDRRRPVQRRSVGHRPARRRPAPAPRRRRRSVAGVAPYLLLLPACCGCWSSSSSRWSSCCPSRCRPASLETGYRLTCHFAIYTDALSALLPSSSCARSLYAGPGHRAGAADRAIRWRTPSRLSAGRWEPCCWCWWSRRSSPAS